MPPKKKGNKKAQDDWEADLGETIAPVNLTAEAPAEDGAEEVDEEGGGGLMAMLRKNKQKRKDKGLPVVEADDTPEPTPAVAQEANMDDEFALPEKKGKGGKGGKQPANKKVEEEETNESGRVLTKAEKEKLKKEREKQRKKEQVCFLRPVNMAKTNLGFRLRRRSLLSQRPSLLRSKKKKKRRPLPPQPPPPMARRRSSQPILL